MLTIKICGWYCFVKYSESSYIIISLNLLSEEIITPLLDNNSMLLPNNEVKYLDKH